MKKCTKCGNEKPLEQFYKHAPAKDGYRQNCKSCCISYRNTVGKNRQLKNRYGINIEDYNKNF